MKSSGYVIAGLVLILAIAAAWWLGARETGIAVIPARTSIESAAQPRAEPALPEEESGVETENADTLEFARRLIHDPDTRPNLKDDGPSTDERDITAENIDDLIRANLDHALEGNMASAYFVTRARMSCDRFASTPEELDQYLTRVNRRVEHAQARGNRFPANGELDQPWSFTDDMEANRVHLERWYDACKRMRSTFKPDLRRQLELLAQGGDVMARYLYATWPEEVLDAGEAFDRQYRWEEQAREFSQANLEAGEVAGLVAFGHSYMSGLFTARNGNLGLSFGVAALNCGFETISVRSYLASGIERLTNSDDPADQQRLQFILTESDRLSRTCGP